MSMDFAALHEFSSWHLSDLLILTANVGYEG